MPSDNAEATDNLTARLTRLFDGAIFATGRPLGEIPSRQVAALYRKQDFLWSGVNERNVKLGKSDLADFVKDLTPLLRGYMQEGTGRIGNGLFLVTGGMSSSAYLTAEEFARILVVAAARLSPKQVVESFMGWLDGEPLRWRERALLHGVKVDATLAQDGIEISQCNDRPPFSFLRDKLWPDDKNRVVASLEIEQTPALYRPGAGETLTLDGPEHRTRRRPRNPDLAGFAWDRFCEAMALASGPYVGWQEMWSDWRTLGAFTGTLGGSGMYKVDSRRVENAPFSQGELDAAIKIHTKRTKSGAPNLDLPIRRWVNSYQGGEEDQLIELRIALEALYAGDGRGISAAIASRGAWHLGKGFTQRSSYYDTLRQVYQDASNVIHAKEAKYIAQDKSLLERGRKVCREAILAILDNGRPIWRDLVLGKP